MHFLDRVECALFEKGSDRRNKAWVINDLFDQCPRKAVRLLPAVETLVELLVQDSRWDHLFDHALHKQEGGISNAIGGSTVHCDEDATNDLFNQTSVHPSHLLLLAVLTADFTSIWIRDLSSSLFIFIMAEFVLKDKLRI